MIEGVPSRVREIEQRFASLRAASGDAGSSSQPLGFGLMLEQKRTEAVTTDVGANRVQAGADALLGIPLTPAVQRTPGAYGPLGPPSELVAFGNGQVPAEALSQVGETNHRLWAPAAHGLTRLIDDAAADGITIGITDSYRPLAVQERLAVEKGLYRDGGLAAVPGTSNHGWGVATDLDMDGPALQWMRSNGWRYGFVEDVPREPWHWTYRPAG